MDPRKREQYECRENTYRRYLALLDRNLSPVELAGHTPDGLRPIVAGGVNG